ncbi:hypothetical protein CLOM_g15994 [Closterium sp. NIES-68]|nr:hypothetical protein CLOM_g15994 [Closterium sp. NIES-68]GJP66260.1 hypothetical protein CLOP_g23151 [Closterium sp. NIES-67]
MSFARCLSSSAAAAATASTSMLSLSASFKSMSVSASASRAASAQNCRVVSRSAFLGARPAAARFFPVADLLPAVNAPSQPASSTQLKVVAKEGYKLKTHKASAKRFRVTGSGKVVRRRAWRAHLLSKKSPRRKNRLAGMTEVFRGDLDKIVGAMPYLKVNRQRLPPSAMVYEEEEGDEDAE